MATPETSVVLVILVYVLGMVTGSALFWPDSELDPRRHTAAALIEAKIVRVAVCPFANTTGVDSSWFDYSNSSNMEASSSLAP